MQSETEEAQQAADGAPAVPAASTFSQFVQTLDGGNWHEALSKDLQAINAALQNHVIDHGGKPVAEMKISIKVKMEGGVFIVKAEHETKGPKAPAAGAVMWSTKDNRFTPHNPKQGQLFGVRAV